MYAKITNNVVDELISTMIQPANTVEYPDNAEINVGSDVRFYTSAGKQFTIQQAVDAGLLPTHGDPNTSTVLKDGKYQVLADYTSNDYWSKTTKSKVKLSLGVEPWDDLTSIEPPDGDYIVWGIDNWTINLGAYKTAKSKEVHDRYEAKLVEGFDYESNGTTYKIEANDSGKIAMIGVLLMANQEPSPLTYPYSWKTADNGFIEFADKASLMTFIGQMFNLTNAHVKDMFTKKLGIEEAPGVNAIDAIIASIPF